MDAATITALAALLTGLGAGPLLLKAGSALWTVLSGGLGKKRDEAEKLRAIVSERDGQIVTLRGLLGEAYGRITRLINTNRKIRVAAERNELLLERAGITASSLPELDEDTDGPWSSELENQ